MNNLVELEKMAKIAFLEKDMRSYYEIKTLIALTNISGEVTLLRKAVENSSLLKKDLQEY